MRKNEDLVPHQSRRRPKRNEEAMAHASEWKQALSRLPGPEVRSRDDDEDSGGFHVQAFLWTLFAFKMATVAAIFWASGGSGEAGILLTATTWPWLIIPGIVLFGWLMFHVRLRRVRARRIALQRAEWMVDEREKMGADVRPIDVMRDKGS